MGTHPIFESDFDCLTEMVIERIYCGIQNYAWGKVGASSKVAQLATNADNNFSVGDSTPYAELWMGTHPKAPARLARNEQKLSDFISSKPERLGDVIRSNFGDNLPFLLKILSVNQALSIQAHPNKKHAEILHVKDPAHYPDSNHKPEMCIALTEFTGLCGFRPQNETVQFLLNVPELAVLIGDIDLKNASPEVYPKLLKNAFTKLMNTPKEEISAKANALVARMKTNSDSDADSKYLKSLLLTLNEKYSGDVGLFNIYFLNYVVLQPGEAMFLRANLPHAYLSGDCVECMACSDNVVRAGLTPKFMDVDTLCEMLDYTPKNANANKFTAQSCVNGVSTFNPDVPDFAVQQIELQEGKYHLASVSSASITIVTSGKAKINDQHIEAGLVFYQSSNQSLEMNIEEDIVAYRAFVQA